MNVLLIQTYANDASVRAVRALGHECRAVNYRREGIPVSAIGRAATWPDVAIIHMGDYKDGTCLSPDLPRGLRATGIRTVWWSYDLSAVTKRPIYSELALACDEIIVCNADDLAFFSAQHPSVRIDHVGIDPDYWQPARLSCQEQACYRSDVSLVGHMYPSRQAAFTKLLRAGTMPTVWGTGKPATFWLPTDRIRYVFQEAAVNLVMPYGHDDEYLFSRHFEIPAVGGFMIAQDNAAVRRHLPMIPTFTTPDEMVAVVREYLPLPELRAQIADESRKAVLANWTLKRFFHDILEKEQ